MRYFVLVFLLLSACTGHSTVVRRPESSVIKLVTLSGIAGGTGFEVVAPSGKVYTMTNAHICKHEATRAVLGNRAIPLKVIEISEDTDLCLLEGLPGRTVGLKMSDTHPFNGQVLDIYGYGMLSDLTRTTGRFVGKATDEMAEGFTMTMPPEYTTVQILPGNSGSPVLNRKQEVVGVAFASGEAIANRALIISLMATKEFLEPY